MLHIYATLNGLNCSAGEWWTSSFGQIVQNSEVLHKNQRGKNIAQTTKRREDKYKSHVWRMNCLPKHTNEINIEGKRRRGRRRKQLPDDGKETRWYRILIEEALDDAVWRTCLGLVC